ncbi:MAG: type II secretion system GspH family protein, partial [Actinobacteria bacterium]|nr:type II secretion system GspH family protein [Actinomycetota bacterium]
GMKKGLTLVELLIVISVLAIMLAFVAGNLTTSLKRGRDAKRKGDLHAIQNALEQYYATCGNVYPTLAAAGASISCASPAIVYMQNIPKDPNGTSYSCTSPGSSCTNSSFTICSNQMEAESSTNPQPTICVTNQQ